MIPFLFQDFGSFSLSLFRILYQVDSLSLLFLFGLVGIYPVPLPVPLSLHLVYIAEFGVSFLYSAVCGVLFIVEFPHCGCVCMEGLSRFPG